MKNLTCVLSCCFCIAVLAALGIRADAAPKAKKPGQAQGQEKPAEKADEKPPAAEPPAELDKEEVAQAREFAAALPVRERGVYGGLRFLMRPEFQDELLRGRKHRVCCLEPLENPAKGPVLTAQALRIWSVLESGMPLSPGLITEVNRLRTTTIATPTISLSEVAIHLAVVRSALSRADWPDRGALNERAKELFKLAEAATDACSLRSSYISRDYVLAGWFTNHFWRAVITRTAAAMGVATESKQWGKDLECLAKAYVDRLGWVGAKNQSFNVSLDLHSNLLALAVFAMAADAPAGLLSKSDIKAAENQLGRGPAILKRLQTTYAESPFGGARLLPVTLFASRLVPEGITDAARWLESLQTATCTTQSASGFFHARTLLTRDLGLSAAAYPNDPESIADETSLVVIALSGGPFSKLRPLAGKGIVDVGMALHALTLVEAAAAKEFSGNPADLVNQAIDSGVDFLKQVQNREGGFDGIYQNYNGQHALCLLALLHGGVARDDKSIERGMAYLEAKTWAVLSYPYEAGIMLMLLQKYYEKEARDAGVFTATTADQYKKARRQLRDSLPPARVKIIDQLVGNLDAVYVSSSSGYTYNVGRGNVGGDSSCTQYAMLGYRAASLLGADVRSEVFKREARRLIDSFDEIKKFKPVPFEDIEEVSDDAVEETDNSGKGTGAKKKVRKTTTRGMVQPGGWGYSLAQGGAVLQFTAAGVGTLATCLDELRLRGELQPDFEESIEKRICAALAFMGETYVGESDLPGEAIGSLENATDGHGAYYNLYSVERGCSLAKVRKLNGTVDWYAIGAQLLIEAQNDDGCWGRNRRYGPDAAVSVTPALVNTCMAILFLRRASMPVLTKHRERDKTPPEDPKKGPITGEPKK